MGDIIDLEKAYKIAKELRWRVWPEEKPEVDEEVIVKYWNPPPIGYKEGAWIIETAELLDKNTWRNLYDKEISTLKWLPLSSLKVLDE